MVQLLDSDPPDSMVEYIPAFTNVTVIYNALESTYEDFATHLESKLQTIPDTDDATQMRLIIIPVCYGGTSGPTLILCPLRRVSLPMR